MVSEATVLQALRGIRDPEAQQDIVTLGLVRDLRIADAEVSFTLAFTTQSPQAKVTMHTMASRLVGQLPGVSRVQVKMGGGAREPAAAPAHGHGPAKSAELIPEVRHTVAVSSGKGGVGKSTVAVNLAVTLSETGGAVGIIDSDVYGRDVPLSLSQVIPLDGVVMVTTLQEVALLDVRKAIGMFQKLNVPLLGVVENMSYFVAPDTGRRYDIFGEGGGRRLAEEYGIPLLAQIPLDPETRIGGDEGSPIVLRRPDSPQAKVFGDLARAVRARLDELAALERLPKIS